MEKYDSSFNEFVKEFSEHELVDAILLSGSRTTGDYDVSSDYDIYIYSNKEIPIGFRNSIAKKYFSHYELNNTTWETEDQGYFKDTNIQIDIVYRNLTWIEETIKSVIIDHQASTGYTTCFLANLIEADILYDVNGEMLKLKNKYDIDYPDELVRSIIDKNFPLLNRIIPAYTHQIEKALKRNDFISVNHRVSAFLESYFDILYAINRKLHPGEKKLLKITSEKLTHLPEDMYGDITELFNHSFSCGYDIVGKLNEITNNLEKLLKQLNLI